MHWRAFFPRDVLHPFNLGIAASMLLYAILAELLCLWFGRGAELRPSLYLAPFASCYLLGAAILAVVVGVRALFGRSAEPFLCFPRVWRPTELVRRLVAAAPLLLAWPLFMAGFTAVKTLLNERVPFAWDARLTELGRELHFGRNVWQWLAIDSPLVTRALEATYVAWSPLLVAVPFTIALRRPGCPVRTRFFVSLVAILVLLGNVVAGVFMSAGPFWFEFTGVPHHNYAGLFAYLTQVGGPLSSVEFQRYLWGTYTDNVTQFGTGISAFPSIHVALATLYALFAWPLGWFWRITASTFVVAIMVAAVHLGWHYSADCYAGFLGAVLIHGAVGAVQRGRARSAVPEMIAETAPA